MGDDITTQILIEIRDSIRITNDRVERTNERLDCVIHEEIRQTNALVELAAGQRELAAGQREIVQVLVLMNNELRSQNARLDNVLMGHRGATTREDKDRLNDLQHRVEVLEKRAS